MNEEARETLQTHSSVSIIAGRSYSYTGGPPSQASGALCLSFTIRLFPPPLRALRYRYGALWPASSLIHPPSSHLSSHPSSFVMQPTPPKVVPIKQNKALASALVRKRAVQSLSCPVTSSFDSAAQNGFRGTIVTWDETTPSSQHKRVMSHFIEILNGIRIGNTLGWSSSEA